MLGNAKPVQEDHSLGPQQQSADALPEEQEPVLNPKASRDIITRESSLNNQVLKFYGKP